MVGGPIQQAIHNHKEESNSKPANMPSLLQPKNLLSKIFIWKTISDVVKNWLVEHHMMEHLQSLANYLAARPYLSMPLFVVGVSMLTPLLIFVLFAIVTSSVTFGGFIIAEGAILAIAAVIVGTFLLSTMGISLVLGTMFSVVYFSLQKLHIIK